MANSKRKAVFVAVALLFSGVALFLLQHRPGSTVADGAVVDERRHPVRTTPVTHRVFEQSVVVQGNVSAKRFAEVSSTLFGSLDSILVDEGDLVEGGVTRLFEVDRKNLERAVLLAKQDLAVARCAQRESEASLEQIDAGLRKATLDFERFQRLVAKKAATSEALEQQQSRYDQARAQRKHGQALVDLSGERVKQSEIAVEIAQKNLNDSTVLAPIDGVITHRLMEPGEIAEPGKPVVRIEDMSTLEVSAYLPADYYGRVEQGQTEMRINAADGVVGTARVSYRSPTINTMLRTFEIRCLLDEVPDFIAPGAMVEVALAFGRHEGLGVPRDAVQTRDGQTVVFVLEQGRARMVPVTTGFVSNGWVEVVSEALSNGMAVVSAGQYMLDDGALVQVQGEET